MFLGNAPRCTVAPVLMVRPLGHFHEKPTLNHVVTADTF